MPPAPHCQNSRPTGLPFAHLNLRRNPFGSLEAQDWGALALVPFCLDALAAEMKSKNLALQFLGNAGRGKSTHLMAIHSRFADQPFTYVGPNERPDVGNGEILFVDEIQRLNRWRRKRAFRRRQSIVIGSHEDLTTELQKAGYETRSWQAGGTSRAALREILHRRVTHFRRNPGEIPLLSDEAIAALHARHGDDLRQIINSLYTAYQNLSEVRHVEMRDIDQPSG